MRNGSIPPAKAGVQLLPLFASTGNRENWTPAFAGPTRKEMTNITKPRAPTIDARRNRPRAMRCLTLFLLALALPSASFAMDARWTVLHEDAAGGGYIDLGSVQRGDAFVDAWLLVDYVEPRSIRGVRKSQSNSALAKVRIDCAGRRSGILALELRAARYGEGEVVFEHAVEAPEMAAIETDPTMIKALELVCGGQR
jgi:hypothetical protein